MQYCSAVNPGVNLKDPIHPPSKPNRPKSNSHSRLRLQRSRGRRWWWSWLSRRQNKHFPCHFFPFATLSFQQLDLRFLFPRFLVLLRGVQKDIYSNGAMQGNCSVAGWLRILCTCTSVWWIRTRSRQYEQCAMHRPRIQDSGWIFPLVHESNV